MKALKEIEKFYYSDFWISRFKRRLSEEGMRFYPLELDCILGCTTELMENTEFKIVNIDENQNGSSNESDTITLNCNMKHISSLDNVIMHEFGHRQYNQPQFFIVKHLNELIIQHPDIKQEVSKEDYTYFTDDNEIRQRIIPIVKEMRDNNWTSYEAYRLSKSLKNDDIRDLFEEEYIIHLLENVL